MARDATMDAAMGATISAAIGEVAGPTQLRVCQMGLKAQLLKDLERLTVLYMSV